MNVAGTGFYVESGSRVHRAWFGQEKTAAPTRKTRIETAVFLN